ncbi:B12-binding domain-containing radical SAM protein [Thermosulfuriphilus sp.]
MKVLIPEDPQIWLINPWIYDFAAFDLWAKPLGLLILATKLRRQGYRVRFFDLLDYSHPGLPMRPKRKRFGTGHYFRTPLPKPVPLTDVPRSFARYGLPYHLAQKMFLSAGAPDLVLVTSLMTYWYPGVWETISLIKSLYPRVPIVLGGIYASLMPEHARVSGADFVISGPAEGRLERLVIDLIGPPSSQKEFIPSYPSFDLLPRLDYVCLLTTRGCPFRCQYCASRLLFPRFERRQPEDVLEEILYWHRRFGVQDFAFYDDALLVDFETHLGPLLEYICRLGLKVRFHTPNAFHVRLVNQEVANLLKKAGFVTLRMGFETVEDRRHEALDGKVNTADLPRAIEALKKAGFHGHQIGVYILWGLPGQPLDEVRRSLEFVASCGAAPYLAEYSPIPGTALWEEALARARYPIDEEPLFQNNSLLPCLNPIDWEEVSRLKRYAQRLRVYSA